MNHARTAAPSIHVAPRAERLIPSLPTLSPALLLPSLDARRQAAYPVDRLDEQVDADGRHAELYYLARNGVYHGLRALGVGPCDTVLMPAYHHGVEVEAVRHTGARIVFYRVDRRMRADLEDAARKADGARVLYLTSYAGFAQPLDEALALCRERGLLLVEDCALALYSRDAEGRPLGSHGDLAIFCLYKTLPVPHGGIAVARRPLPRPQRPPLFSTLHHLGGSLRARAALDGSSWLALWSAMRSVARHAIDPVVEHEHVGTQQLDPEQLDLGASRLVRAMLSRIDPELVVVRRRRNYLRLRDALDEPKRAPFTLPPGACPLFFPLLVDDKVAALAALRGLGVEGVDFWSGGDPACSAEEFPDAAFLRRHVLELPIHQDLDDEAVDRVARAVKWIVRHA